ncbi:MAG: DUF3108 domain-containing protein [Bacteroidetes bacterium]|nr:DUF3108 domain-containing protein [Bacteroidota bacterium]
MKRNAIVGLTALGLLVGVQSFGTKDKYQAEQSFEYRKMGNTAFQAGEKLKFRAHYGVINAAVITMSVGATTSNIGGRTAYAVKCEGETLKSFDWAYKVRDKFESWVDVQALAPLRYAKTVRENKYFDEDLAIYMHDKKKMRNSDGELAMPIYTQDIASALYYARNLNFTNAVINQSFPIDVYLDNKVYNLNFTYLGKETLNSDIGKVKCIKLRPKLVVDRVFKSSNDMTVWISDDANHIPIRVQSAIKVGSIKVDLTSYEGLRNTFTAKVVK